MRYTILAKSKGLNREGGKEFTRGCSYDVQVVVDHDMDFDMGEEGILGYMVFKYPEDGTALIKEVYVHEEHRRLGVARSIMDFALSIWRAHGCKEVLVRNPCPRSYDFWRGMGLSGPDSRGANFNMTLG